MIPRLAGCESDPLTPVAIVVKVPVAAVAAAENNTEVLAPALTLNGLRGLEMTPAGKSVRVIWTVPLKPLSELTDKMTGELVAPCSTFIELLENPIEKSGEGGGGGGIRLVEGPPPHPADARIRQASKHSGALLLGRPIEQPPYPARAGQRPPTGRKVLRARPRSPERVTPRDYKTAVAIVKLRNILEESSRREKSKGGEDRKSAPPLRKVG